MHRGFYPEGNHDICEVIIMFAELNECGEFVFDLVKYIGLLKKFRHAYVGI